VVLTRPQPQAPNLLGATGTGPLAGHGPWCRWKSQTKLAQGIFRWGPRCEVFHGFVRLQRQSNGNTDGNGLG
jgi:hypothetical protein